MKHSYLLTGIKLQHLIKLLARNRITFYPKYFFRLLFLLQSGVWSSIFAKNEAIRFGKIIKSTPLPDNPIIIIGHWRTGSTLLHQLMNLDNDLTAPTLFQVTLPDSFLNSRRYYEPAMKAFMGKHRPMDQVKLGFDEPMEDEWATFRMTNISPLERVIFPKSRRYFLLDYDTFVPDGSSVAQWEKALCVFFKKLAYSTNKRIVLKNPFHSLRIKMLKRLFPNVRFIHIYRHPYTVIPSTIRMWNIVGKQNSLNKRWTSPQIEDVVTVLDRMLSAIQHDLAELPDENYCEVKFEELEKEPVSVLKKIYHKLGLTFTPQFENKVNEFLPDIKHYKKNIYTLSRQERELISNRLKYHIEYYGYKLMSE